jgi:hypothetical protein
MRGGHPSCGEANRRHSYSDVSILRENNYLKARTTGSSDLKLVEKLMINTTLERKLAA